MKTLLILRHAKSDHADPTMADHDRPLNERGKRDAPRVGERLLAAGLVPERILSSTARRAKKTAEKVAQACRFAGKVELFPELYLASPAVYRSVLAGLKDDPHRVMVVGHNPGLEGLLRQVTGELSPLPTAALARVDFDIDSWTPLAVGTLGKLTSLWLPREDD